ncbi:hypothetical protein AVEN_189393-1 [Araneus ventricosus]|uniref:BEN domain-containing protein n=1 Tax=Araneus ventricosus TaxID=182803 RepID=A0A4Y2H9Z0_ARAVE|nr:hypothetical protein AVEN_189393-1 [Araneus ventricosus]
MYSFFRGVSYLTKKEVSWNRTPSDPFSNSSIVYPSDEDLMSIFQKCENHPTQFAVNIARILFTREELRESNCRGKKQKSALEKRRLLFIHDAVMKLYQIPISSQADIWKQCIKRIDTRCRHERRPRFKDFATSDSFKEINSYY